MSHLPAGFDQVTLTSDRLRDVLELDMWAFPTGDSLDDLLGVPSPLTWERTHALVRSDQPGDLVALHSSYPFGNCPVPGGRLKVAGLTWVGVHPQWRRQGLLRAMIETHFANCRDRGEPVSMLFAAEPAIYGRFGYGTCARALNLTLSRKAALRPVPGAADVRVKVETLSPASHGDLVTSLHAGVERPGWVTRESPELKAAWFDDAPMFRNGREVARIMVAERDGDPVGYAVFRRQGKWGAAGPEGTVRVSEVVAPDAAVTHALWSRLLDLDLTIEVTSGMLAVDDPLLSLLVDVRAARGTWQDNTWLRVLDVPAALEGRQYQAPLDVVLELTDPLLPQNAGRWRLTAEPFGTATARRTEEPADLSLDIRELGAAYLGGTSLTELTAAGLVTELTPGSLPPAAVAFGWPVAPVTNWIF